MYQVSKEVPKSIFLFVVFFYTENNPQNQIPVKDENVCNGTETALTALNKVLLFFFIKTEVLPFFLLPHEDISCGYSLEAMRHF